MPLISRLQSAILKESVRRLLREALDKGRAISSAEIAQSIGASEPFVCKVRNELIRDRKIPSRASAAQMYQQRLNAMDHVYQRRIQLVREAKFRAWFATGSPYLSPEQLDQVLPS